MGVKRRRRHVEHSCEVIAAAQASPDEARSVFSFPNLAGHARVACAPALISNQNAASRVSTLGDGWISSVNHRHTRLAKQLMWTHKHTLSSGRDFSRPASRSALTKPS